MNPAAPAPAAWIRLSPTVIGAPEVRRLAANAAPVRPTQPGRAGVPARAGRVSSESMAGRGKGGAPPAGRNHQDKWVLGACLAVLVASAMLLTRDLAAQPAPAEASHLIVEAAASSLAFVASVWAASRFRSERRRGHEPTPRREREPDRERRDGPRPNAAAPRQPVAKATNGAPAPVGRVGAGARRPEGRPRLRIVPPPRE